MFKIQIKLMGALYCTIKFTAKREAKSQMQKMPPDQRWQGWPKKDPEQFLFPFGSPVTLFGYQINRVLAREIFSKKRR